MKTETVVQVLPISVGNHVQSVVDLLQPLLGEVDLLRRLPCRIAYMDVPAAFVGKNLVQRYDAIQIPCLKSCGL